MDRIFNVNENSLESTYYSIMLSIRRTYILD